MVVEVEIGTSGWHYDDWKEIVYPKKLRQADWLTHLARRVSTVEINSTYYSFPRAETVARWVEKAKRLPGFTFSVKIHSEVSHSALLNDPSEATEMLADFQAKVLTPLNEAGALAAVLMQVGPQFTKKDNYLENLDAILTTVDTDTFDWVLELRNKSWLKGDSIVTDLMEILDSHRTAICGQDGPAFPRTEDLSGDHAYFRFHGRNDDIWQSRNFTPSDGRMNRYDYLYSKTELKEWLPTLKAAITKAKRTRVYFNNHPRGKAVVNAEELRDLLEIPKPNIRPKSGQLTLG